MIPGGNTDSRRESSALSRELSEAIPTEQARTVIVSRRESSAFSRGLSEAIPTEQARTRNCFPEGIIWRDPG